MSIAAETSRVSYSGDGVTTVFPFAHPFLNETDLVVISVDSTTKVATVQTLTTHYTVSGEGTPSGGSVTMLTPPASGTKLVIYRDPPITQTLELSENDILPVDEIEASLDKLTQLVQRVDNVGSRSVRLPEGFYDTFDTKLPSLVTGKAGYLIGLNATEDGFDYVDPTTVTSGVAWGGITGTLSDQADLQAALDAKADLGAGVSDGDKGDITVSGTGATWTIDDDTVTNAKAANMATQTIKGRTTAGTGDPEDLTATQATAILNAMVGDSGSGGTKGLVPAPSSGDAAAGKYLKADGTWAVPPGGGGSVDDTAYDATSWNGVTTDAPSKNAVRDQIEAMVAATALKAPLASPTFTGTPAAPTASQGNNSTQLATTAFVKSEIERKKPEFLVYSDGSDIGTIVAYADASATSPVDGSGGSPASTIAVSTDSSVVGTSNFLWTKSAANRQGEGWSQPFTIDAAYKSKPMTVSGLYRVDSGTYTSDAVTIWIYDVTNGVLIQPSAYQLKNTTGVEMFKCEFQAASNSTSYRLIFHTSGTDTTAYTLRFASLSVSPNTYSTGASVGDWSTSVTLTPSAGFGSLTTQTYYSRRVGGSLEVRGYIKVNGATAASTASFALPSGYAIDYSRMSTATNGGILGYGETLQSSGTPGSIGANSNVLAFFADGSSTSTIFVGYQVASSGFNKDTGTGITGQSNVAFAFHLDIPIVGWGSSQILSSDTDTRVCAANIGGTLPGTYTANTAIVFPTINKDTHGAYSASTGEYTIPAPGYYQVSISLNTNQATASAIYVAVDGTQYGGVAGYTQTTTGLGNGATTVYGTAGQKITARFAAAWTAAGAGQLSVVRVQGPAQVAASESVIAIYSTTVAATASTSAPVQWSTKVKDSHGAVTTGSSWKFTAPISGTYSVSANFYNSASTSTPVLYKNGSSYGYSGSTVSNTFNTGGCIGVSLLAGEYLDVRTAGSVTVAADSLCNITIVRVGNY